jgi:predicted PurR-regulated permease PerM
MVAGFILLRQLVVDAALVPRVTKETIGLSPLTVFAAVLAGTHLFGPLGALLAIPMAAAVQIIIADALTGRVQTGLLLPPGWRWLQGNWDHPSDRPPH